MKTHFDYSFNLLAAILCTLTSGLIYYNKGIVPSVIILLFFAIGNFIFAYKHYKEKSNK